VQQIVDGITAGSIYAALALALVLVYRSTGLVNFAQGQMAVVSVYIGWSLVDAGFPVVPAVLATLVVSLVIGALTERLLIRRFEGSEPLVAIVATVAVLICFNGLVSLIWGGSVRAFPSMFPDDVVSILGARATWGDVGVPGSGWHCGPRPTTPARPGCSGCRSGRCCWSAGGWRRCSAGWPAAWSRPAFRCSRT
jgi:branched-chain amino acid transport system permease protein